MITDLTEGKPSKILWSFSIPMLLSVVFQQLYNIVDSIVAGKFVGAQALAAVGASYPITMIFMAIATGANVGAAVIISQLFGAKNFEKLKTSVFTSIISMTVLAAILTIFGIVFCSGMLKMLSTPENIFSDSMTYLNIYIGGLIFLFLYNICTGIFTAMGDSKTPLYFLIMSSVGNIILDLVFVIVFNMGVAGVGWATFIAQGISSLLAFAVLLKRVHGIKSGTYKKFSIRMLGHISRIAIPSILQQSFVSVGNLFIQSRVNSFGSDAVAGSATGLNFEYFTYFTISAFVQAAVTFTSQNYGARNFKRCKKIFVYSMISSVVICGLMSAIFVVWRDFFAEIYTTDKAVLEYASIRMVHVLLFECLASSYEIGGAALRGLGYSMTPAVLTVLGSCVFRLIWIYTVFNKFRSFEMLMNVYPVSWIITGIAVLIAYAIVRKKLFKET